MRFSRICQKLVKWFALFSIGLLVACTNSQFSNTEVNVSKPMALGTGANSSEGKLQIWWTQGFLPEENEVINRLVREWEKKTGKKADLKLLQVRDINGEAQLALSKGKPPDVLYSATADTNLLPSLAWYNQLADISDLILPMKNSYSPIALQSVYYENKVTNKRAYYALPIGLNGVHIFYWKNYLQAAGFTPNSIPQNWHEYWQFWGDIQNKLRLQGQPDIYGMGLTMSALGTDTFSAFEQFLAAHNAKVVDENGTLVIDRPENRASIIIAMKEYTRFYQKGYVPPQSLEWTDSGNNISFLENHSVMTVNSTLSIPLTQRQEDNQYNKQSRDLYFNQIVTADWPKKPDGGKLSTLVSVKQVVIFEASKNKEDAKSFLSYLVNLDNQNLLLKDGNKGRLFPVIPKLLQDPFWSDRQDPHFTSIAKQIDGITRPYPSTFHPAYSEVLQQNIWAKAIISVIKDGVSPEKAGADAIEQIKEIFAKWQSLNQ